MKAMDDLPVECLERMLEYVSLRDLQRCCVRVSRKWQTAVDFVVGHRRPRLRLMDEDVVTTNWHQDCILFREEQRCWPSFSSFLLKFRVLQHIDLSRWTKVPDEDIVRRLVFQNSKSLISLTLDGELPFESGIHYPRLQILSCDRLEDPSAVSACPGLHSLSQYMHLTADVVLALPATQMSIVKAAVTQANDDTFSQLVHHICSMHRLCHLKLYFDDDIVADHRAETLILCLFTSPFPCLHSFSLTGNSCFNDVDINSGIRTLVTGSPGLRNLHISGFSASDDGLNAMHELANLSHVSILPAVSTVTGQAIAALMKSMSAVTMQQFDVWSDRPIEALPLISDIVHEIEVVKGTTAATKSMGKDRIRIHF